LYFELMANSNRWPWRGGGRIGDVMGVLVATGSRPSCGLWPLEICSCMCICTSHRAQRAAYLRAAKNRRHFSSRAAALWRGHGRRRPTSGRTRGTRVRQTGNVGYAAASLQCVPAHASFYHSTSWQLALWPLPSGQLHMLRTFCTRGVPEWPRRVCHT
jgi:hypothetical protein